MSRPKQGAHGSRCSDCFRVRAALAACGTLSPPAPSACESAGDHAMSPRLAGSMAVSQSAKFLRSQPTLDVLAAIICPHRGERRDQRSRPRRNRSAERPSLRASASYDVATDLRITAVRGEPSATCSARRRNFSTSSFSCIPPSSRARVVAPLPLRTAVRSPDSTFEFCSNSRRSRTGLHGHVPSASLGALASNCPT